MDTDGKTGQAILEFFERRRASLDQAAALKLRLSGPSRSTSKCWKRNDIDPNWKGPRLVEGQIFTEVSVIVDNEHHSVQSALISEAKLQSVREGRVQRR